MSLERGGVGFSTFLKDVFICSLGAYGGPEAHYGIFTNQMVVKKKYVTEEELTELMALTSILPGPSSTQTIISMGYKFGGVPLALLTMLVWSLPVLMIMTGLSFMGQISESMNFSQDIFKYVSPMALGFIISAIYNIGKKTVNSSLGLALFIITATVGIIFPYGWLNPILMLAGGFIAVVTSKEEKIFNKIEIKIDWTYLFLFFIFAIGLYLLNKFTNNRILQLFDSFYRYGYLVIGGGQVVIPFMNNDLVYTQKLMTNEEFLRGYGIVQGMPGPMFSFAAYAGGMATRDLGTMQQILGAGVSGIAIFLPGIFLIFFVYPIWEQLKKIKTIKLAIKGIAPVACGLILASALRIIRDMPVDIISYLVAIVTTFLLYKKTIPAPLIVIATILLGVFTL